MLTYLLRLFLIISVTSLMFSSKTFSSSIDDTLHKAQQALTLGEFKTAQIHIKNILKDQPENIQARTLLVDIYLHIGDGAAAEIELNRLTDFGAQGANLQIMHIKANLIQGYFKAVTDHVTNITKLPAKDIGRIRALQGQAYINQNKVSEAKNFFLRASKLAPDSLEVRVGLARLHELNNKTVEANAIIDALEKQYPYEVDVLLLVGNKYRSQKLYLMAFETFEKAREIQPGNIAAWLGSVGALIANNDYEKANQYVITVLKLNPEHELANHLQAIIAYQLKKYATAEQSLQIIEKNNPSNKDILWLAGSLAFQQQRYEEAEDKLEEFVQLNPDHLPARKTLSAVYLKRRQGYKVIQLLSPFENTDDSNVFALLGSAYTLLGNKEKGSYYLERAASLAPENKHIEQQIKLGKVTTGKELSLSFTDNNYENFEGAGLIHTLNLLRQRQTDSAIELLKAYQEINPANAVIANLLGSAQLQKKDPLKARESFKKAIQLDHQFLLPKINLARLDTQEKNYKQAKQNYLAILEQEPGNVTVLIDLAQLSQLEKNKVEMIRWLKKAAKLNKSAIEPRLLLNQYYYGLKNHEQALLLSEELIELQPENIRLLKLHADNLLAANKLFESTLIFQKITKIKPQSSLAWQWLASTQYLFGNYKKAKPNFQKSLELNPKNTVSRAALIQLALSEKNITEAQKYADLFIKLHPKLPLAHESTADILLAKGDLNGALKQYQAALKLQGSPAIILKVYRMYIIMGQQKKAENILEDWLIKYPNDLRIRMITGLIYQKQKRYKQAQKHYEIIVNLQPENVSAINNLALIYDATNDPRNIEYAEIAYSLAPDTPDINDTLGWILLNNGVKERAIKLLKYAAKESPTDFEILYHYAVALYETGDKKEAMRQLYMIVPLNKQFPGRANAVILLEKLKQEK